MVLVGGVNFIFELCGVIVFFVGGVMLVDGKCKLFDVGSDGFVCVEGCGVILLKCLSDVMCDGDLIIGVIWGSVVNLDGCSVGLI